MFENSNFLNECGLPRTARLSLNSVLDEQSDELRGDRSW